MPTSIVVGFGMHVTIVRGQQQRDLPIFPETLNKKLDFEAKETIISSRNKNYALTTSNLMETHMECLCESDVSACGDRKALLQVYVLVACSCWNKLPFLSISYLFWAVLEVLLAGKKEKCSSPDSDVCKIRQ